MIAVTRKGSDFRTLPDFRDKHLVYINGASYPELEGLPRNITYVNDYKQSIQMLRTRTNVDGAIFSEPAYYYWMHDLGFKSNDFGPVIEVDGGREQWVFVRKDLPEAQRKILKQVVDETYQARLYEQLLDRYGKGAPPPPARRSGVQQ